MAVVSPVSRGLSAFNLRSIMDVCGVDAWNEVLTLHKQELERGGRMELRREDIIVAVLLSLRGTDA